MEGELFHADRRTDMTKLLVDFHNFFDTRLKTAIKEKPNELH